MAKHGKPKSQSLVLKLILQRIIWRAKTFGFYFHALQGFIGFSQKIRGNVYAYFIFPNDESWEDMVGWGESHAM